MHWEETLLGSKGTFYIGAASVALLVLGFLFDISTSQALVVAITYNIPIALSSLALSRRLTLSLVGAALFANLAAGYINALSLGGVVATAIANRGLAALSYLLAGFLILMLKAASSRITALKLDEARAKREHDLRRMMTQLSGPLRPQAFMEQACGQLRDLLEADAVVVSGLAHNRFAAPRYSDPAAAGFAKAGDVVPWVVAAAPSGKPCVLTGRSDRTTLTVGLWRRQGEPELVVMAIRAKAADANTLLAEALQGLEPLLERAVLLENLDRQRGELSRRNTVIRDLVYAFSHDLRTPLLANAMNMQLALDGAFGDLSAEFRRTLENGLDANEDLLELADSLLLVARYESGELPSKPEPVNLVTVLRQAHARLEPVLEARSLCMRMEAPGTLMVRGRPAELRRLFQNLLDNAAKFSEPRSTVEVRLYGDGGDTKAPGACLEVLDRGSGVPPRQRERLFQRFSGGKAGGGTGLGLYLANQIVTEHGGTIRYRARDGGGSCFCVWLPLAGRP